MPVVKIEAETELATEAQVPFAFEVSAMSFLAWAAYRFDQDKTVGDFDLSDNLLGSGWTILSPSAIGIATLDPDGEFFEVGAPGFFRGGRPLSVGDWPVFGGSQPVSQAGAYLAIKGSTLAVVFRGSDNTSDLVNGALNQAAYFEVYAEFLAAVLEFVSSSGGGISEVYVTGHSLGGAMAEWFAYYWAEEFAATGVRVVITTFGSPGTSLPDSANPFVENIINFGHTEDPVFTHFGLPRLSNLERHGYTVEVELPNVDAKPKNFFVEHSAYLYQRSMQIFAEAGELGLADWFLQSALFESTGMTVNSLSENSYNGSVLLEEPGWLFLGPEDDIAVGSAGNDYIASKGGSDFLNGMDGVNNIFYLGIPGENADVTILGGIDTDFIYAAGLNNIFAEGDTYFSISTGDGMDYIRLFSASGSLNTGSGNDWLELHGPTDFQIRLGEGSDAVWIMTSYSGDIVFADFETGPTADHLELWYWFQPGYGGLTNYNPNTNPFDTGHFRLVQNGSSVIFQIDRDGGGNNFVDYFTFSNHQVDDFDAFNLGGWAPDSDDALSSAHIAPELFSSEPSQGSDWFFG